MGCGGRINTQINDFVKGNDLEKNSYAIYEVLESSRHIVAIIRGPPGTPYEGGVFEIDIRISKNYPFTRPNCKFATKIWHIRTSRLKRESFVWIYLESSGRPSLLAVFSFRFRHSYHRQNRMILKTLLSPISS